MARISLGLLCLGLVLAASLGLTGADSQAHDVVEGSQTATVWSASGLANWVQDKSPAITCDAPTQLTCGQTVFGTNQGYPSNIGSYTCSGWDESGPEVIYEFDLVGTEPYTVTATLSDLSIDLDVFLLTAEGCSSGQCLPSTLITDNYARASNVGPGTYNVSVDGYLGNLGTYSLTLTCEGSGEPGTCANPIPMVCGDQIAGDTTGGSSQINGYACNVWDETGPEDIYYFTLPAGSYDVTAALSDLVGGDLDVFLLGPDACDGQECLAAGENTATHTIHQAGTYFISVDGFNGAEGSYLLDLTCTPIATPSEFVVNTYVDNALAHDTNPGDGACLDGQSKCSLRAAMEEANALPDSNTIRFDELVFSTPQTITVAATEGALPLVTRPLTITASSVWDTTNDLPRVTIDGAGLDAMGLTITANGCRVYGLHITGFGGDGIRIASSADNRIGGPGPGSRNVLSGNGVGLALVGSDSRGNVVQGNYIGVDPAGSAAQANVFGVSVVHGASVNTIGGSTSAEGNIISGNSGVGVWLAYSGGYGNKLGGNLIGLAADGTSLLGNGNDGVQVSEVLNTQIGTGVNLAPNVIAGSTFSGIRIGEGADGTSVEGNNIRSNGLRGVEIWDSSGCNIAGNSIHDNALGGIALFDGSNGGISAPTISNAGLQGASGLACAGCTVEVFSDSGNQGRVYHGLTIADPDGLWVFWDVLTGPNVTATATDAGGNTSQFSTPYALGARTLVVNTDADDASAHDMYPGDGQCLDALNRCSLRAAIREAEGNGGFYDTITFDGTVFDPYATIRLDATEGALPLVLEAVRIDASAVWDTSEDRPGVIIDGQGNIPYGLNIQGDACEVYGLQIMGFTHSAISVESAWNTIGGTDPGQRNVLSGNGASGLRLTGPDAAYNTVRANYIGLLPTGDGPMPNGVGISISGGAHENTIGGALQEEGNVVSGNTDTGVRITDSGTDNNMLGANRIGPGGVSGVVPNGGDGIRVSGGAWHTEIGGYGPVAQNDIYMNDGDGVHIAEDSNYTRVVQNQIHHNGGSGVAIFDSDFSSVEDNTIAVNGSAGVMVCGPSATGNRITANRITLNAELGIQLAGGSNGDVLPPTIASASTAGSSGTSGCSECTIELFSDDDDEGHVFEGSTTTDTSGHWTHAGLYDGPNLTATTTDGDGNTSEFSAPYPLGAQFRVFLPLVVRQP